MADIIPEIKIHGSADLELEVTDGNHDGYKWVNLRFISENGTAEVVLFGMEWNAFRNMLNMAEDKMLGRFETEEE